MDLFIQIKDGEPFEHPIMGDNFIAAFPHIDVNNLPPEFARFVRPAPPEVGPYQVASVSYGWDGDVVTDIWQIREMSEEEKQEKIAYVKSLSHPDGAVFSEELCEWVFDLSTSGVEPNVIS